MVRKLLEDLEGMKLVLQKQYDDKEKKELQKVHQTFNHSYQV